MRKRSYDKFDKDNKDENSNQGMLRKKQKHLNQDMPRKKQKQEAAQQICNFIERNYSNLLFREIIHTTIRTNINYLFNSPLFREKIFDLAIIHQDIKLIDYLFNQFDVSNSFNVSKFLIISKNNYALLDTFLSTISDDLLAERYNSAISKEMMKLFASVNPEAIIPVIEAKIKDKQNSDPALGNIMYNDFVSIVSELSPSTDYFQTKLNAENNHNSKHVRFVD